MSYIHSSGMTAFAATETVVRPQTGFCLKESKYSADAVQEQDKYYYVVYGEQPLQTFNDGRVSLMTVIDCPNSEPAEKAVKVVTAGRTRYVYVQEACGLFIEREAAAFYDERTNELRELRPTNILNPESVTKGGFVKENYVSLQLRLLKGEKFNQAPATPYERGLFALGRIGTLYPDISPLGGFASAEEKHDFQARRTQSQLFVLLTNKFFGHEEILDVHAFEVVAHLKAGNLAVVSAYDPSTGEITNKISNGVTAIDTWVYACKKVDALGAGNVKVTLL